mgnify:CR=1 FL=1
MIKIKDIRNYQAKVAGAVTIREWKSIGRELRDRYNLTDRQALDILKGDNKAILEILEGLEHEHTQ